ncbi:hypothetical protein B5M42_011300 [Paenibacillus athensensis]|uniref:WD40/YVTN/BNR-like repeat-containing protein n=1 Tax=Paenibacillus athensensis TaxID=1967502 RepID=UPI00106F87D5|nr:hypothetical protein [Paenibacillus athensensis]MCD1259420.1 hypothetical protein [Paenibacillus athensensis]
MFKTVRWMFRVCTVALLWGSLLGCTANTPSSTVPDSSPTASKEEAPKATRDFNYRIHRYDAQTAWAVGSNPANTNQLQLLMTHDGGEHWQDVTPNSDFPVSSDKITSLDTLFAYVNPDRFWIIQMQDQGIAVYTTADGGVSWNAGKTLSVDGVVTGFSFADEQQGWVYVNKKTGLGYAIDEIYRTENAGSSWEMISSVEGGGIPMDGEKAAPSFANGQVGFMGVSMAASEPTLYRTDNGGKTWKAQKLMLSKPIEGSPHLTVLSPSFLNEQQGILPVYYDMPGTNQVKIIFFQTTDRGQSWTEGPDIEASPDAFQLQYDFVSLSEGWLCTDRTTLYKSMPSWTPIFTAASEKIDQFDFINSTSGWAVFMKDNKHLLMETKDGGQSWSALSTSWY